MKINHLLAGTALATTLMFAAGPSMATPIDLTGGYTGQIVIHYNNYESFTSGFTTSSQNYGIVSISSIVTPGGNNIWVQGQDGQYLAGVFDDVHITKVESTGSSGFTSTASGGNLNLYMLSAFNPTTVANQGSSGYTTGGCSAVNTLCYNGITNGAGAQLLLSTVFTPGINANPLVDLKASATSVALTTLSGTAVGFLHITGGNDTAQFGLDAEGPNNGFTTDDLKFSDTFCANGTNSCKPKIGNWQAQSSDPVKAGIVAVPEPGSLALLGAALLGMVPLVRRRKNKKSA
jgi:hypothetical protein